MRQSVGSRRVVTDPRARLLLGVVCAAFVVTADVWLSGFYSLRSTSTAVFVTLSFWLLTPVAEFSERAPLRAGCVAALFGTGIGSLWWALLSPGFWIWIPMSVGACLALFSLAPLDYIPRSRPDGRPPRSRAVITKHPRITPDTSRVEADEASETGRHRVQSQPSV